MENCYPSKELSAALKEISTSVSQLVTDNLAGADDRSKAIVEKGNNVLSLIKCVQNIVG